MGSGAYRVLINTVAQYLRSVVSILISLFTTKIILGALGEVDYGIYSLVGGVVAMLTFISNALVSTTQRFLSYHQSREDISFLSKLFGNILILHLIFSAILITILEFCQPWLFSGFLNISPERISAAKVVYQCAIFMIITSFMSAPFLALLIAHENILYSSIIQIIDSFIRLTIALIIPLVSFDKLQFYVLLLCGISIFDFLSYSIYASLKYKECDIPSFKDWDKNLVKKISNFLVWQIYSTGCIIGRTQGTAVVINKFFGTILNSSFGIAQQVSGAVSFISSSLLNAINPRIIKAEGTGNRAQMFSLAKAASKFSTFLLAMFVVPLVIYMPIILKIWLGKVPEYTTLFCRVILITSLIDQITIGLGIANQAIGNVRSYALIINSIKFLTVPLLSLMLYLSVPLTYCIWIYAIMELICALCRLPYLRSTGCLNVSSYIKDVFFRLAIPISFIIFAYFICLPLSRSIGSIILCCIIISLCYICLFFYSSLLPEEKNLMYTILRYKKSKT